MNTEIILNEMATLMEIEREDLLMDFPLEQYGNWDSLTAISTMALIDTHLGVLLSYCEFEKCKTLNDIFKLVDAKKSEIAA